MANILLVSDDKDKIKHYDEMLTKFLHDVQFASDTQMFFDVLNIDLPQIILLDADSTSIDLPQLYRKINSVKESVVTISVGKIISEGFLAPNPTNIAITVAGII